MSIRIVSFFFFILYGYHRYLHVLTHSFPTRLSSDLMFQRNSMAWTVTSEQGRCYYIAKSVADTPKFALRLPVWQLCMLAIDEGAQLTADIAKKEIGRAHV